MTWREELDNADYIACDIEISDGKLACFGFATSPEQAYVIPVTKPDLIEEVCNHPVPKVWANGKFDLYFLKYRYGVEVQGEVHDVMAAWFALYPELAGSSADKSGKKRKNKVTRKSLSFLASVYTLDKWWKGDYSNQYEFFIYNGKDCCITYDVWNNLKEQLSNDDNSLSTYDHVRSLIWPCVDMLERGLLVDETLRLDRLAQLQLRVGELRQELDEEVRDELVSFVDSNPDVKLFNHISPTCKCCRHSKNKQDRCWGCAGFRSAPSKKQMVAYASHKRLVGASVGKSLTKAQLSEKILGVCGVCQGEPRQKWVAWNASSHHQNKLILYEILRLPKRYKNKKLSSDAEALKGLLGGLKDPDGTAGRICRKLLLLAKTDTMVGIYNRIAPAGDGRVHSDQSPYGTETSRFSHSETFLYPVGSTNLANLPKRTATDRLYSVRDCIIPSPGRQLLKADYSAAEARWCAWMADDRRRITAYENGVDLYKVFVALLEWDDESRWEEVNKTLRNVIGKVGILSGQYGVSWKTLQDNVNSNADITGIAINAKKAKKMVDIWDNYFPETIRWHNEIREHVLTKGWIENPYGFRRYFFGRKDTNAAKAAVVREAIAFGPQSANAMMLNKSLSELYEQHDPHKLRVLLQVHDEIVLDCLDEDYEDVVQIVKNTMEKEFVLDAGKMLIPAEIERCITSWSDAELVG